MGRKNLLSGLLNPAPAGPDAAPSPSLAPSLAPAPPERARPSRGAIGAVSQSIADLKARAILEIDPWTIEAGGMQDRLESDAAEDAELARSIAEYGQQVPILVRPHPEKEGRYQIVYGRRRVLALRDLGQPVKALVRDLDDHALVMAQGQENTARRNLSFIEKASFAYQMTEAGYDRKAICDALAIDKTAISRMLSVVERIPQDLIRFIGAAPSIGRDRWLQVADMYASRPQDSETVQSLLGLMVDGGPSDERFAALQTYLERPFRPRPPDPAAPRTPRAPTRPVRTADGLRLGAARRSDTAVVIRLDRARSQGFEDWLLDRLPDLHRDWLKTRGD
ncbi:plasmid partitioning protein RepB [Rubellimicrobium aerolatum]|uniref:Plasmid partitioning protein RepB n=1 Tax=Rubellimicrobium aerolatum TaxID=490979 RepID=A0ABW0SGP8_9RHOB|nr:plasmid partitioning protein RepB [Rubellimicrobium aerolatum]MBP1807436.1 ParB family chromosome partitioning protein [Rubellimicrobium aerolatum]